MTLRGAQEAGANPGFKDQLFERADILTIIWCWTQLVKREAL